MVTIRAISLGRETGSRRTRIASTTLNTSVVPPSAIERIRTVTIAKLGLLRKARQTKTKSLNRSLNITPSIRSATKKTQGVATLLRWCATGAEEDHELIQTHGGPKVAVQT